MGVRTNGTTNSIRIPRNSALEAAAISLCAWLRRIGPPATAATAIAKTFNNGAAEPFVSYDFEIPVADPSRIDFGTGSATLNILSSPTGQTVAGKYFHVVGTYNPTGGQPQKRLYINGVLVASSVISAALSYDSTPTGDFWLGQDGSSGGPDFRFNGDLSDVRVYNRSLAAEEVATMFIAKGRDGIVRGLVGRWTLQERADGLAVPATAGFVKDVSEFQSSGAGVSTPVYSADEISILRRFTRRVR